MVEFRPPVRGKRWRVVAAVVMVFVALTFMASISVVMLGSAGPSYTIAGSSLTVTQTGRIARARTVALTDILEARVVTLENAHRTNGTSLPGLCSGDWSYPDLGAVWQLTDCSSRAVTITTRGQSKPIVITPPDPELFVSHLRSGEATAITLPPPDTSGIKLTLLPVAVLVTVTFGILSAIVLRGPEHMVYGVGSEVLEVRTLFGRQSFPLRGAGVSRYAPSYMWRMMGTALPGYLTGRFRESGKPTRVYATDRIDCVLYESEQRVIVSPEDREGFLAACEREGARVRG
jgi:Bacterial PH domain